MSFAPNPPSYDPTLSSLPSLAGAGSLAQSARLKQLKIARGIMFGVGILTIAVNLIQLPSIDSQVDEILDKQAADVVRQGKVINQVKLTEIKDAAKRASRLILFGFVGIGVLYIVFGLILKRFPVPVTISGLVIYVGSAVVLAVLAPETILSGIIIKIAIVVALAKALQAALAYQKALQPQT